MFTEQRSPPPQKKKTHLFVYGARLLQLLQCEGFLPLGVIIHYLTHM